MIEKKLLEKHLLAYAEWDAFLQVWPIERLRTMELAEYTQVGGKDTFTYWLETKLEASGCIRGMSAFKFGIFSRQDTSDRENSDGHSYSSDYGWYSRYGATAAEAFSVIRTTVVSIAEAASNGVFDEVESAGLDDSVKWKIAFHYQSREHPVIVDVFKRDALLAYLSTPPANTSLVELYRKVSKQRDDREGILEFGTRVWETWSIKELPIWKLSHGGNSFSQKEKSFLLKQKLAVIDLEVGEFQSRRFRETPIGTIFYLCYGNGPQLLARFTSVEEPYVRPVGEWKQRSYEVLQFALKHDKLENNKKKWAPGGISTFWKVPTDDLLAFEGLLLQPYFGLELNELRSLTPIDGEPPEGKNLMQESPRALMQSIGPLNRILYGPPGTGKTYRSVAEAVAIVEGVSTADLMEPTVYPQTKMRFDRYRAEGRIEFVTFHPSYSYQDFVEGIRPQTTVNGGLTYDVEPGVLKRISEDARSNWETARAPAGAAVSESERFERTFSQLLTDIEESTSGHVKAKLYRGAESRVIAGAKERSLIMTLPDYQTSYNLPKHQLKALWMRRSEVKTPSDTKLYNRSFFWAALQLLETTDGRLDEPASAEPVPQKVLVLVIHVVIRANTSNIFGELITLIEDDKRLGAENAMTARLPYSPEERPFGLPPNLYLIGTMNTADRSIALMDTALRRRFSFIELMPNSATIISGPNIDADVPALLDAINARIEYLFDREHTIGHAYFCGLTSFDDLAGRLMNKVIPLLQEYFHEDWSKIRLVFKDGAGKSSSLHVVKETSVDPTKLFGQQNEELESRVRYTIADTLTVEMVQAIYQ